ncbi:Spy/CpxP family protein refolding chaperone [Bradyrhizobium guangxiense]
MQWPAKTTLTYRLPSTPTAFFILLLAGLATPVHAATSAAEPREATMLLAMMDDMDKMGGAAASQPATPMSSTGAMSGGMCCMGSMGKAPGMGGAMAMPSALPGFPGASHLYHVGASGFFVDYAEKIGLTVEQSTALNAIKQRSLIEQSAAQRNSEEAEQALWMLTAADQPDATAIEAKVREIEKIKSDARLAFIRAVGEAANVLTPEQRKMVLGMVAMPGSAPMKRM